MNSEPVEAEKGASRLAVLRARGARWGLLAGGLLLVTWSALAPPGRGTPATPSLVVGVAEWRNEGGPPQAIQASAAERLEEELRTRGLDRVQVIRLPVTLASAREVDRVAEQFGVDLVVWGWYDEVAVRGYVDLADATDEDGKGNCLTTFLERGGSPDAIRVLDALNDFDYIEDGMSFCVPRWTP